MQTPSGKAKMRVYGPQDARVGTIPLDVDSVLGMDLKEIQCFAGYPIEGLLGMDFLRRYILHVDFDRGQLLLLKSTPDRAGEVLPLHWNSLKLPQLEAKVSSGKTTHFTIDTGALTHASGMIETSAAIPLLKDGELQNSGHIGSIEASGTLAHLLVFQGKRVSLGEFSVERPIFRESPQWSAFDLYFLSRFLVTLDFPNSKVYLQRGQNFEQPDLNDLSGLALYRSAGNVLIYSVVDDSPASKAGIKAGDMFLTLGTSQAGETSLFELRKALCKPGTVACSVRRGWRERRLTLDLGVKQ